MTDSPEYGPLLPACARTIEVRQSARYPSWVVGRVRGQRPHTTRAAR
jgi:hypothetical protein